MTAYLTHAGRHGFVTHAGQHAFVLHGTAPIPPPADLDCLIAMTNRAGAPAAMPVVSFGHPFAKGHVPAGSHVALFAADGTTPIPLQQDRESYWSDGSLKFAALSFVSPDTFADAQKIGTRLKAAAGNPSRDAGANTLAALTAAHDFKVVFSGGDCGADVFTVSVNAIIANGRLAPAFGVNPIDGYEVCKSGPICTEWRFWSYLKRDSDNGTHAWIKANLWVRAWGAAGPYQISGLVTHPNAWGPHPAGTVAVNGGAPPRLAANIVLRDGASALYHWGGASDPLTFTMDASAFDVANGFVTWPSDLPLTRGQGVTFSGGGTPSSLTGGIYWLGYNASAEHSVLATYRAYVSNGAEANFVAWQPSHAYVGGDVVSNSGARYAVVTAGTSGSTGPTGTGTAITDGSVVWTALTAPFGTAGTGNCTVSPIPGVHLHCGVALISLDGHPLWVGAGAKPVLVPSFDLEYLYHQSRMTPPFMTNIQGFPYPSDTSAVYNLPLFGWDIASTGDNPGDDRIGYLQHTTMCAMLTDDLKWDKLCRVQALDWTDFWLHYEDERCGWAVTTNNGPDGAGSAYPSLAPPAPMAFSYGNTDYTAGLLAFTFDFTTDPGYNARYGVGAAETSHLPALWVGPYLRTGHDLYLHLGLGEFCAVQLALNPNFGGRNRTIGGTTYYGCTVFDGQVRGIAWGTKACALAEHVCPANHAIAPLIRDCMDDSAAALAAWYRQFQIDSPGPAAAGWYMANNTTLWQLAFCTLVFATEALKDERPGWRDFLMNYNAMPFPKLFDDANGGSSYHIGASQILTANPDGSNPTLTTPATIWPGTYGADWVDSPSGVAAIDAPFNPSTDYVMGGMVNFPWATNSRQQIGMAACCMQAWLGTPRAAEVVAAVQARFNEVTPGIVWAGRAAGGTYAAYDSAYPPFAIEVPS